MSKDNINELSIVIASSTESLMNYKTAIESISDKMFAEFEENQLSLEEYKRQKRLQREQDETQNE